MANGEIVIRIIQSAEAVNGESETSVEKNEPKTQSTSKTEQAIFTTLVQHAAKGLRNATINEAKYVLGNYFKLTDNYMANQNMNIALNIVGKAAGYVGMIAAGPVGWALAAVTAVNDTFNIINNYKQQEITLNKMHNQLEFQRQRAGFSLTAGSIGENR